MTERVLELTPPPHFSVQVERPDQLVTLQSMGQAKVLQSRVLPRVGQATPPWAGWLITERDLDLRPVPQVLVQDRKGVHLETLQSMGQAWRLQVRVWRSEVQEAPPWATLLMTDLVRNMVPVPQVLVQLLKPDQVESLQSMGQANLLQATVWTIVGQATPPWAAWLITERVRVVVPAVPQVLVQVDQAV
jgi:hypothetical protein